MRFCFLTTFYPPYNFGGDAYVVQRLAEALAVRGHDVHVIHDVDAYTLLSGGDKPTAPAPTPNITTHPLAHRQPLLGPLITQQTGRPLVNRRRIAAILAEGFDVIHFFNASLVGGMGGFALGAGVKLMTTHEYWLICETHTLFKYNQAPCEQRNCIACSLRYGRPPQLWRYGGLRAHAIAHLDAIIAPTRFVMQQHQQAGIAARYEHLPQLITPTPLVDAPPVTTPYFLFAGRLERLKGLQTLIPLFRRYRRAELWVAGQGRMADALQAQAGDADNIRFLGRLSQHDLQRVYRGATAVLLPSLWYEVQPLVVLEGYRQQTPALVRNLGSMPEFVAQGGSLAFDDEAQLEQLMDMLLDDPARRDALGMAGYRAIETTFSVATHLSRYFALIDELQAAKRQQAM